MIFSSYIDDSWPQPSWSHHLHCIELEILRGRRTSTPARAKSFTLRVMMRSTPCRRPASSKTASSKSVTALPNARFKNNPVNCRNFAKTEQLSEGFLSLITIHRPLEQVVNRGDRPLTQRVICRSPFSARLKSIAASAANGSRARREVKNDIGVDEYIQSCFSRRCCR